MLEGSSLVLELYRDDICQSLYYGRPLKTTMALAGAAERFVAVSALITQLWDAESRLRALFGKNEAESDSSYFGNIFECARMRTGFFRSVDACYPPNRINQPVLVVNAVGVLRRLVVPSELQFVGI